MIVPIARYFNPSLQVDIAGTALRFADGEGLNVRFDVRRTMTPSPDTAEVAIANLDPLRAKGMGAVFSTGGATTRLEIQAGYDGLLAGLFRGDVRKFQGARREGPDVWTTAIADDGGDALTDTTFRISTVALTAQQMVETAAAVMRLTVHPSAYAVLAQADANKQGPYTAVMTGQASDLLTAAAQRIRCRWWIRDAQVFLGFRGQPDASRPAVVIKDEALVSEPSSDGSGLATFEVLLDPNIVPGSQVARATTLYRVETVSHRGETRGGVWTSTVTGRAL